MSHRLDGYARITLHTDGSSHLRECFPMRQPILLQFLLAVVVYFGGGYVVTGVNPVNAAESDGLDFFEAKIRPVLVAQCYSCHSEEAKNSGKLKGGLLLDSREGTRAGGDTGPSVIPGQLDESLLIDALRYGEGSYQMPPAGKLPPQVIADFEKWVALGAPDPRDKAPRPTNAAKLDWEKARQHWSLRPPVRQVTPSVANSAWVQQPIDAFILARLEAAGLQPTSPADRRTLLRRVTFDLTGLPPTLEQQQTSLNDESPAAYTRLVDQLLASPQHGERWGRHWLDVARYAEDNTNMGPFNGPYHHAWRYRDWVVRAMNEDVPYDEFIVRQLATDFLPETGPEDHAALGFQGLAPSYHKEVALAQVALENRYADEWEDRIDAIGRGLLGLTLACARCHDHKYDPVTNADYYALAGVFASSRQTTRPIISEAEVALTQPARDRVATLEQELVEPEKQVKELTQQIAELEKKLKAAAAATAGIATDSEQARLDEAKQQLETKKQQISAVKAEITELKVTPGFEIPVADSLTEEQVRVEEINKERMKIVYYPNKPRDLNIFVRGEAGRLGPLVPRRFLQVFSDGEVEPFTQGSGRLELAQAIASRDNPLTARVLVNRVWMHHFGVGLVDTPSNFGVSGSQPSHPELLDDLTIRFMDHGWSLRWLHREILLSATFQQATRAAEDSAIQSPPVVQQRTVDPDNRLLSFFPRRRLHAEAFRDAVLAVSDKLDQAIGGPSGDVDNPQFSRRTIYAAVSRHKLSDTLQTFDFPDPAIHCEKRVGTTTPLQQMFVLNSLFMQERAASLAERIRVAGGESVDERVTFAYRLLFARDPREAELSIAREFLSSGESQTEAQDTRWSRYAHALLSSNEFLYVD